VSAVGDSKARNAYSFEDASGGSQKSYYRIVEHDMDGKTQQTRIVAAQCHVAGESQATLSPNPVGENFQLNVPPSVLGPVTVDIYDVRGIVRQQQEYHFSTQEKSINVSKLPSGIYLLKWTSRSQKDSGTIRFLKE
jgi:hypothetical protein